MNIHCYQYQARRCFLSLDAASCRQSSISRSPQLFKSALSQTNPEEAPRDVSEDGFSFSDRSSDVRGHQQPEEEDEVNKSAEEEGSTSVQEAAPTPQFCSKHQRWVKSILRGCSEELLLQPNVSSSPLLFPSSSSTSSSQDLTPSDLIPCPSDQPPSQTRSPPRAAVRASRTAKPKYRRSSGSLGSSGDASQAQIPPQASSARGSPLPARLSPVVRLVNIGSFETSCKHQHASPKQLLLAASFSSEMLSSPHHTSGNVKDNNSSPPSAWCRSLRHRQKNSRPRSGAARRSSSAAGRDKTSRGLGAQLRLSLPSQGVLLHSKLLQPYVSLTRLSSEQCHLSTQRKASSVEQGSDSEERRKQEEEDSSFDVNALYSTDSSSSDGEESPDRDPDYRPHIKKKRLLLEYENARVSR